MHWDTYIQYDGSFFSALSVRYKYHKFLQFKQCTQTDTSVSVGGLIDAGFPSCPVTGARTALQRPSRAYSCKHEATSLQTDPPPCGTEQITIGMNDLECHPGHRDKGGEWSQQVQTHCSSAGTVKTGALNAHKRIDPCIHFPELRRVSELDLTAC